MYTKTAVMVLMISIKVTAEKKKREELMAFCSVWISDLQTASVL